MKKLVKVLLCLFVFIIAKNHVLAEQAYIYLGDEIPGVRLHLKTPTVEKNKKMYQIINRNTGELVYCIEPGVVLKNGYFTAYSYTSQVDIDLTTSDWNYLRLIALYGYQYQDRTDIKWYAVTQFMIWEYLLEGEGEIYFIDDNNQKIDLYKEEIAEIQADIDRHAFLPSFMDESTIIEMDIPFNEEIVLVDENHVLEEFSIETLNDQVWIENNELHVKIKRPGRRSLCLYKRNDITEGARIFYSAGSQTVMNRGTVSYPTAIINFDVEYPSLTVIKKSNAETSLSLKGAVYQVYFENGSLWDTITTNEDGVAYLEDIPLGQFYLQEIEAPYGFLVNEEKIYFEVVDGDVTLEVEDALIQKEIVIEKYLEDHTGNLELEKEAAFQLFDVKTNEVIATFQMNEYGKYQVKLGYGDYLLRQIAGKEGYKIAEDHYFTIDEDSNDFIQLVIKNPEITGNLLVEKKDFDTGEPIMDEAVFKIFDVDKNEYLVVNGVDEFKTQEGKLFITDIPYGNYELMEVEAPFNYQVLEESYPFQITGEKEISLEVFNQLQNGALVIEKLDYQSLNPLEGVTFGLYDQDYELIGEYTTDQDGKITISNLLAGLYYIKELNALDGYEILNGFMDVDIKNNLLSTIKVTNRTVIEVPMTGINSLFYTILFSAGCLLIGAFICNHEKSD